MSEHDVLTTLAELEQLADEWGAAAGDGANPLFRPEWTMACATGLPEPPLAVHTLRHNGELVAVAPLRTEGRGPGSRHLSLWGITGEPTGYWYRDADALTEIWSRVIRDRKAVMLSSLWDDPTQWQSLEVAATGRASVVRHRHHHSGWAPLGRSWEDFESSLSSKARAWLRRKRRRLEQRGAVTFETASPAADEVGFHMDRLIDVEAASWKGRAGTAMVQDHGTRAVMAHYARLSAGRHGARFFHLLVDGRPVASHLYAVGANRLWQLKIGYDEEFADCSPGILLMHEVLEHACRSGMEAVEYLGKAESWQNRWPLELHRHRTVRIYPRNPNGVWNVVRDGGVMLRKELESRRQQGETDPGARPGTGTAELAVR